MIALDVVLVLMVVLGLGFGVGFGVALGIIAGSRWFGPIHVNRGGVVHQYWHDGQPPKDVL